MYSKEYFLYIIVLDKMLWRECTLIQDPASVDIAPYLLFIAVDKASHFIGASIIHVYFTIKSVAKVSSSKDGNLYSSYILRPGNVYSTECL